MSKNKSPYILITQTLIDTLGSKDVDELIFKVGDTLKDQNDWRKGYKIRYSNGESGEKLENWRQNRPCVVYCFFKEKK